jgi:hypothetical protein
MQFTPEEFVIIETALFELRLSRNEPIYGLHPDAVKALAEKIDNHLTGE